MSETIQNELERERKGKAHLDLNLVRKVKGNRKDFYRCIDSNTRTGKKSHGPAAEWGKRPMTKGMEKAKVLNASFASIFTGSPSSHRPLKPVREHGEIETPYTAKD